MPVLKIRWLNVPSFPSLLLLSAALRVILIIYSEWHDAHSTVKYTDVDYRVFSDAARFVLHPNAGVKFHGNSGIENRAQGPLTRWLNLQIGSPWTRQTYRYTPLLAILLLPNELIHLSFGKYLFAACDLVNGVLLYQLLVSVVLPSAASQSPAGEPKVSSIPESIGSQDIHGSSVSVRQRATLLAATYLLNPMVFTISTRGSSESILGTLVLLTLYCLLHAQWDAAAVLLGLSTHWKIYPVIYGVGCLGIVGTQIGPKNMFVQTRIWQYIASIVNRRTVRFTVISAITFFALGAVCYAIWGYPFLYEAYLYHLHRRDHRHNFSPYFYLTYLTYPPIDSSASSETSSLWEYLLRSPLTSFVPQMSLCLGTGLLFGRRKEDVVFTWFVQTFIFVLFNKVCTSQYFLWYLIFAPLLVPMVSLSWRRTLVCVVVWAGTQALWLEAAYRLEFLGQNVFFGLWARSLGYVIGNAWVLGQLMDGYARGRQLITISS